MLYTDWTKNLSDPETKSKFEREIYSSRSVLERLHELCNQYEDKLNYKELQDNYMEIPNFEIRVADMIGQRKALSWIKKLVDLDQQTKEKQ